MDTEGREIICGTKVLFTGKKDSQEDLNFQVKMLYTTHRNIRDTFRSRGTYHKKIQNNDRDGAAVIMQGT